MNKIKAAIADDSELVRNRLAQKLQRIPDVEVVWQASDGREALSQFINEEPDIMILDVQMPSLTGLEMLQNLKANKCSKTTFIVLTNYPVSVVKKKCLEAGADYFFDKTTEFDKVFEIIRSVASIKMQAGE